MTIDEFLIDELDGGLFLPPLIPFWLKTTLQAMALSGAETDREIEELSALLRDYSIGNSSEAKIRAIPRRIVEVRGPGFWRDVTPLGIKYRCLNALAVSVIAAETDPDEWLDGILTSFQLLGLLVPEPALIAHISASLRNRKVISSYD